MLVANDEQVDEWVQAQELLSRARLSLGSGNHSVAVRTCYKALHCVAIAVRKSGAKVAPGDKVPISKAVKFLDDFLVSQLDSAKDAHRLRVARLMLDEAATSLNNREPTAPEAASCVEMTASIAVAVKELLDSPNR